MGYIEDIFISKLAEILSILIATMALVYSVIANKLAKMAIAANEEKSLFAVRLRAQEAIVKARSDYLLLVERYEANRQKWDSQHNVAPLSLLARKLSTDEMANHQIKVFCDKLSLEMQAEEQRLESMSMKQLAELIKRAAAVSLHFQKSGVDFRQPEVPSRVRIGF